MREKLVSLWADAETEKQIKFKFLNILLILSGLNFIVSVFLLLMYGSVLYFINSTLVCNILIIFSLFLNKI
jgi:hypothetical protein